MEKFYFTTEQLENTPSTKDGIFIDDEIKYRVRIATFLQALGEKLKTPQLCINTAIVFVKRFFMYHSMKKCDKHKISLAALFLACKSENSSVKLEQMIQYYLKFVSPYKKHGVNSEEFKEELECLKFNEFLILMTLGFEVIIEHPHLHIVKNASLFRVSKDVIKLAYFTASKSLHLTSLCLQFTPKIVACFSIHLAALKFQVKIPDVEKNQPWFSLIEKNMTHKLLDDLTESYSELFENHEPWSSVAKKMTEIQAPKLNLNLSIGITRKQLSSDLLDESSILNESKNQNLHSSLNASQKNLSKNNETGMSSTLNNLQLKFNNHVTYFSTPNREILQTLLRHNEKEIHLQSPIFSTINYLESRNNLLLSSFDENLHFSSSQNNHSTPKITSIPFNYNHQLTPVMKKDKMDEICPKENYQPRRNFLKNLETSNIDHLINSNHEGANYFSDHQSKGINYNSEIREIWQPFLPQINHDFKKNERCQKMSIKRQSYDLNDSIMNKRRCLSNVDTFQSTTPQYKFNFFQP
ncbi:cyclin-T1-2-like [Leptopilina heterotoma]|uniref:cyclin-T1-2-like n=1 Tax=Leptopilina heterotoma TaxID=63436 RepID=UPI001CA8879A|nr:cyclin-T1-2-like [Leptopilina heterotoma]